VGKISAQLIALSFLRNYGLKLEAQLLRKKLQRAMGKTKCDYIFIAKISDSEP
jgi:hypothetical protein